VYIAKHKVDQQEYMIKKIKHKISYEPGNNLALDIGRLLQEVRVTAAIRDLHIIRYYNSWLEILYSKTRNLNKDSSNSYSSQVKCYDILLGRD